MSERPTAENDAPHCWLRLRPHHWHYDRNEGSNGVLYSISVYVCDRCGAEMWDDDWPVEIR